MAEKADQISALETQNCNHIFNTGHLYLSRIIKKRGKQLLVFNNKFQKISLTQLHTFNRGS